MWASPRSRAFSLDSFRPDCHPVRGVRAAAVMAASSARPRARACSCGAARSRPRPPAAPLTSWLSEMVAGDPEPESGDQLRQPEAGEDTGSPEIPASAAPPDQDAVKAGLAGDPEEEQQAEAEDVARLAEEADRFLGTRRMSYDRIIGHARRPLQDRPPGWNAGGIHWFFMNCPEKYTEGSGGSCRMFRRWRAPPWPCSARCGGEVEMQLIAMRSARFRLLAVFTTSALGCLSQAASRPEGHFPGPRLAESVTDRSALEALYRATDGPNWGDRTNWLSTAALTDWYGVSTDGSGRVTNLELCDNELSGTVPPELSKLSNLRELDLRENRLSGAIPKELVGLSKLEDLDLRDNRLSGAIPPELGRLTNLQELDLRDNEFSGTIPPELGRLTRLRWLQLSDNRVSGAISKELGSLNSLRELDLRDNRLSGAIPPELGRLTNP